MRLYEEYVTGNLDKEGYVKEKSGLSEKEEMLKAHLLFAEQEIQKLETNEKMAQAQEESGKSLVRLQNIIELTPVLTKELIKQIIVFPDETIKIEWNFSDEIGRLMEAEQHLPISAG